MRTNRLRVRANERLVTSLKVTVEENRRFPEPKIMMVVIMMMTTVWFVCVQYFVNIYNVKFYSVINETAAAKKYRVSIFFIN